MKKKLLKILSLLSVIFPHYAVFVLVLLFVELISYRGFVDQFIFIDSVSALFLLFLFGLMLVFHKLQKKSPSKKKDNYLSYLLDLNTLFFPSMFIVYYFLDQLEKNHYPNYVYSNLHLNPAFFVYIVYFSLFLLSIKLILMNKKIILKFAKDRQNKSTIFLGVTLVLVSLHLALNIVPVFKKAFSSTNFIVRNLDLPYEEKMEQKWGLIFPYSIFVSEVTEPGSKIIIPPQLFPWGSSGNAGLVRYFFYPRTMIKGELEDPFANETDADYILIARGGWSPGDLGYGWPKQDLEAEKIYIWERESNEYTEYENQDYIWEDERFHQKWGLIKLKENK